MGKMFPSRPALSLTTGVRCCVKLLGHTQARVLKTKYLNASRLVCFDYGLLGFVVACKMMISPREIQNNVTKIMSYMIREIHPFKKVKRE